MAHGHLGQVLDRVRRLIGADGYAPNTDAELLERFQVRRDGEAFAELLQRHGPMVQGVCRRVLGNVADAEDAFQATFLLFARKADSIQRGTSLPGWLHRVAYRLSLRARANTDRRRAKERVAAVEVGATAARDPWDDLRPVVDEELQRLPAKYRDSIVLRYLQGKSNEEAARHFDLPPGSMSWRLSRALELLRQRLARRGVLPTAAVLAALLVEKAAPAAVPAELATATAQAAVVFACGGAAEGATVSVRVYLLVEGGLRAMFLQKLIIAGGALLLVLFVGALGMLGYPRAAEPAVEPAAAPQAAPAKADEAARTPVRAVAFGLRWIAAHQAADGHWSFDKNTAEDIAATALALLPFLQVGETHTATGYDHVYAPKIGKGLRYLADRQQDDGRFGTTSSIYGQAMATWAMCEAYRLTRDPVLKQSAQRSIDFAVKAQHNSGSWGYIPGNTGDTSISSWMVLALTVGKQARLNVPEKTLTSATVYLDNAAAKDGTGYCYTPGGRVTASMTAAAISCRMQLGWKADHPALVGGVKLLKESPPKPEARNAYYFQWGTRALKSVGGDAWKEWQKTMTAFLLENQTMADGEDTGSWRWENDTLGAAGGRHLITSLSLLALEQCAAEELVPVAVKARVLSANEQAALWQELAGSDLFRVRQA